MVEGYLGNSCFVLLHELVHVLLVFLHARLQVVLLPLHTAQLLLQLGEKTAGVKKQHSVSVFTNCV